MMRVAPLATLRLVVMLYGPAAAVQVVFAAVAPPTVCTLPSSYQMSMFVRSNSTPLAARDWTRIRLIPGVRVTLSAVQVPCQATYGAGEPFTRTRRVSMALAAPESVVVAVVDRG